MAAQYTIEIHDEIRPVVVRMSRPEGSNILTLEIDYLPRGKDSRDGANPPIKTLTNVYQRQYAESKSTSQYPAAVVQAALTISDYLTVGALAQEFPE